MMSKRSFIVVGLVLVSFLQLSTAAERLNDDASKRTPGDFPALSELVSSDAASSTIPNTDCVLTRTKKDCSVELKKSSGQCSFDQILAGIFPSLALEIVTKNFIVPGKYIVKKIVIEDCDAKKIVSFRATSSESVEIVPQHFTLGVESLLRISWKYTEDVTLGTLNINLRGTTSVGADTAVVCTFKKQLEKEDYEIQMEMSSLSVNAFMEKFGIDTADMIDANLVMEKRTLGVTNLNFQTPKIKGIFSAGNGFEITATGEISAPEFAADATSFYVIVQDFKKRGEDEVGFQTPIGGIFALYKEERVVAALASLSGLEVPRLAIFRGVRELAITVATKKIVFINSEELNKLSSKFIPAEGLDFMDKGLSVMHLSRNSNDQVIGQDGTMVNKILFRCGISHERLSWVSPLVIQTTLDKVAELAFSDPALLQNVALPIASKVLLIGIDFVRQSKSVQVNFNLTEGVPVLNNDLVSLVQSTITLHSSPKETGDKYQDWKVKGKGNEVILDDLVQIDLDQTDARTTVTAVANIFNMKTLRNRTHATYLPDAHAEAFPYALDFPLLDLRYEASFEFNSVLKMKGKAVVHGKPNIEIVYYMKKSGPRLKLAMVYNNEYLHLIVNQFDQKQMIKSTWMKFSEIVLVFRNDKHSYKKSAQKYYFDRPAFKVADGAMGANKGIGILATTLDLTGCDETSMVCNFLNFHFPGALRMNYKGIITPTKTEMTGRILQAIWLGPVRKFTFGGPVDFTFATKIDGNGDRIVMHSRVRFDSSEVIFPAKIYDDGSNKLILDIGDETSKSSDILQLSYAKMDPLQSKYSIPDKRKVDHIELKSRLHIGTVAGKLLEFPGDRSRQYIYLEQNKIQFVGVKNRLSINDIVEAFGAISSSKVLEDATFKSQVVMAYNSVDQEWSVPDYDIKVKKGLHFFGKLTMKTNSVYQAIVSMTEDMTLEVEMELTPLRYGKSIVDGEGRPHFESVNLFLFKSEKRQETGPTLFAKVGSQYLKGYCQTLGMEGEFVSTSKITATGNTQHTIQMSGKMYDEVNDVTAVLTTEGNGKPDDFEVQYHADLTQQAQESLTPNFREVLGKVKERMTKGKTDAATNLEDVTQEYDAHDDKKTKHEAEMQRVLEQMQDQNSQIDAQVLDITTDCVTKCKTVAMPGIEWKEDCALPGETAHNVKCMVWNEDKEKVVNVICILKCEAEKLSSSENAISNLRDIRLLLNRYKEMRIMAENEGKMIDVINEAKTMATDVKAMIDDKTSIGEDIDALLATSGDLAVISRVLLEGDIKEFSPPCLSFKLSFAMNTGSRAPHEGTYDVCFNGEFYENLGIEMLKDSYPQIDEMYKAIDDAELSYARIKGIKKSLERVLDDIRSDKSRASKRSDIGNPHAHTLERSLLKIASRRLPKFTTKGDHTMLAFRQYSPWAVARRSNPFSSPQAAQISREYNMSHIQGRSHCHQKQAIVKEYKKITNGLKAVSGHYQRGKTVFENTKGFLERQMQDSHAEILRKMNQTALSPSDQIDMMYWYEYTKEGLKDYFDTLSGQLSQHNKKGLEFWRSDVSAFFGNPNVLRELHQIGQNAYSRSQAAGNEAHVRSFNNVGESIQKMLSRPGMTLEEAGAIANKLDNQLKMLKKNNIACY